MFNKLLSNLPFNPSLIHQVSFYAVRLKKEASVRRLGFVFVSLSLVIQTIAVIAPPESSVARADGNDIIPGGFKTHAQANDLCYKNTHGFQRILWQFGITCDDVAKASTEPALKSTDYGGNLFSMGRHPYGKQGEYAVPINGVGTFYMRYLRSWDSGPYSTYKALVGTTNTGKKFMILYDCGNLVWVGQHVPEQLCPYTLFLRISDPRCKICPHDTTILIGDARCKPPKCPLNPAISVEDPNCRACPLNPAIAKTDGQCQPCPHPGLGNIWKYNAACKEPCKYNPSISSDSSSCKPCEVSKDQADSEACVVLQKKVRNITQNIADANDTTASAGDELEYTLIAKNTGKETVKKFVVIEMAADVLEYADIVDLNGGKKNDSGQIMWAGQDIRAGQSIEKKFIVKVKSPIPQTPVSLSNPGSYDLVMNNVYGNAVNVKLQGSVVKATEQIVHTIPNTGPGEAVALSVGLTIFVGYFFARSRLMAKELVIVKQEYASSGS